MGWLANAAIREARLLKQQLKLASYAIDVDGNVTGFVDANGDPVYIADSVADSIMWMGDSLTAQSGFSCMPLLTPRTPYYSLSVGGALEINGGATRVNYLTAARCDPGCLAAAGGTLAYNAAAETITWTAPGDSAGAPVNVSGGGWFKVNSATAGMAIYLTIYGPNRPVANTTDSLSLSGATLAMGNNTHVSIPGHFNGLYGNPFGEKQYWFCGEGFTAAQFLVAGALAQWRDVYTDITYIDLGTNGISSKATADSVLTDIQSIITYRKAVGSRVIVKSINLPNVTASAAGDDTRLARHYANARLRVLAQTMNFELIDVNRFFVDRKSGTLRAPSLATMYNTDQLHLSGLGAYMGAAKALYPVLSKYMPERSPTPTGLLSYDSAKCPTGNLLTNGLWSGTSGTKGSIMTGDLATSWSAARAAGSTITGVGTMPGSGVPIPRTDDVPGYWAEVLVDNTNASNVAGEALRLLQTAFVSGSNYTTDDVLVLTGEAEIEFVSGTGVWGLMIFVAMKDGGRSYALNIGGNSTMNSTLWNCNGEVIRYKFSSLPLKVIAGATNLNVFIDMYMHANSTAKFRFSQDMRLSKVVSDG